VLLNTKDTDSSACCAYMNRLQVNTAGAATLEKLYVMEALQKAAV
jgi:hypothetical protein